MVEPSFTCSSELCVLVSAPYFRTTNGHSPTQSKGTGEEEQRREFEGWREQNSSVKKGLLWAKSIDLRTVYVVTPTAMVGAKETGPRKDHRWQQLREPLPYSSTGAGRALRGRIAVRFPSCSAALS